MGKGIGARKGGLGTGTRRIADVKRLAEAIKTSGIDPRHWCSYGTVAVVDDSGDIDVGDQHAVWIGPEGVEVDVLLEPLQLAVTAHYFGIMGGCSATIVSPIKPGDQVLVVLPEGDLMGPPVIVSILHSASCPQPMGDDRKPLFKNDRVLVYAEDVSIDVRTKGGAQVLLEQNGEVTAKGSKVTTDTDDTRLGARGAPEQLILGTSYRGNEMPMLVALQAFVDAVAAAIAADGVIPPPLKAAVAAATSALNPLIGTMTATDFLSRASRTK